MNILEIFKSFQTQEQAVAYLEKVRWGQQPHCPYCGSLSVGRHASPDRKIPRWQCRDCTRAFSVTVGTPFHGTHIPLRNWFLVLALMLNAKKSMSAYQISRDLGMRRPTVWSMMQRIRAAMAADSEQEKLLYELVEADETYISGKPRRGNNGRGGKPMGSGTKNTPVIGAVERRGRAVTAVADGRDLSATGVMRFIERFVDPSGAILITDEWRGDAWVGRKMLHTVVNHSVMYADGMTHTNTIEGFWALLKRAWHGSHHHYSEKYVPLYIAEVCHRYNGRASNTASVASMRMFVGAAA